MPRLSPRSAASIIELVGWLLLGAIVAARMGTARRSALLELFDIWKLYILAPWALLGVMAAWIRSPSLGVLAGIGTALTVANGRAIAGRGRRPEPTGGPRLRVLTANVLGGNPSAVGLVELIERLRPDVVAVQEVRPRFGAELTARLSGLLPYYDVQPNERFSGAALFSHWPLEDLERFKLAGGDHLCQRAQLRVDGRHVQVWNVHFDTPFEIFRSRSRFSKVGLRRRRDSARDDQIDCLIEFLAGVDESTILLGDFNAAAGSRPHRQLLQHLRDAFGEVGHGFGHTYPQADKSHALSLPFPLLRIDYVFLKGFVEPLSARPVRLPGSDHRGVLADLEVGIGALERWPAADALAGGISINGRRSGDGDVVADPQQLARDR